MVLEKNYGAVRANDQMHQRSLEQANDSIKKKLDRIIELLEKISNCHGCTCGDDVVGRDGKLNASEALYGFGGWLTSSDKVLTISAKHDASVVAELVGRFCEANGLEEPREGWEKRFVFPEHIR